MLLHIPHRRPELEWCGHIERRTLDEPHRRREPIFVETVFGPRADVGDMPGVLDGREQSLGSDGSLGHHGMVVAPPTDGFGFVDWEWRVEGDEDETVFLLGEMLEDVHVICAERRACQMSKSYGVNRYGLQRDGVNI